MVNRLGRTFCSPRWMSHLEKSRICRQLPAMQLQAFRRIRCRKYTFQTLRMSNKRILRSCGRRYWNNYHPWIPVKWSLLVIFLTVRSKFDMKRCVISLKIGKAAAPEQYIIGKGSDTAILYRLPETQLVDRPKAIIDYAQESRMALLKLLALLRWKEQADVPKVVRTVKNKNSTTSEERQGDVQTAWVSHRGSLLSPGLQRQVPSATCDVSEYRRLLAASLGMISTATCIIKLTCDSTSAP